MIPDNAIELSFEEQGKGLPVVMIHGFPLDHTIWEPAVPLLRNHARLILPDLRGFGKSPLDEVSKKYTMRMFADDILALLDRLQIEKAAVVGHSMGGYAALAFAHAYPHRLLGLGLICSQAAEDTPEKRQNRLKMADEVKRRGLAHAVEGLPQRLTCRPELVEPVRAVILRQKPTAVIAAQKGMADRPDATEWLPSITVPSVVISGDEDVIIPNERAHEMAQLLGWSWQVQIPHAAHMPMMEEPAALADALHKFFHTIESNQ